MVKTESASGNTTHGFLARHPSIEALALFALGSVALGVALATCFWMTDTIRAIASFGLG